ncbi:MAG: AAA family ATPase [Bacteroidota bacterium]|jgi:predicted ATPase
MKESIHIKNLGPIKDIFLNDIKPFTVLIGESASGKSTLMKALALFRWISKMQHIRSYLKHSNLSKSPFRFRMETYLNDTGLAQYITEKTEVIYITSFENGNTYTLEYRNRKLTDESTNINIASDDLQFNKISFISETRNIIPLWAQRGASLTGAYLGFYFHETYSDFDKASETLKEIELGFLNARLEVKELDDKKEFVIKSNTGDTSYEIDFRNSSSGTQNAAPIALISAYFARKFDFADAFNRSVLRYLSQTDNLTDFKPAKNLSEIGQQIYMHIEEPELSLYPDAQCELLNDLIKNCFISTEHSISLILSTHSPYIINHLNLLIRAFDTNQLISGAKIDYNKLTVYQIEDGQINNLMSLNERLVDTNILSETINNIYDQYANL